MFSANFRQAASVFGVIARRQISSMRKGVVQVEIPQPISQNWSKMFAQKFIPSEFLMENNVIKIPFNNQVTEFFGDIFLQNLTQNAADGCDKSAACLRAIDAFKNNETPMIHLSKLPMECESLYIPFFDAKVRGGVLGRAPQYSGYMPAMTINAAFASCVGLKSYAKSQVPSSTIVSSVFIAQGTNRRLPHRDDLPTLSSAKMVKAKPDFVEAISIQAIFSDAKIATYLIEGKEIYERLSGEMQKFLSQEIFYLKNTQPNFEKYKFKILDIDKDGEVMFNFDGDLLKSGLIACNFEDQIYSDKMLQEFSGVLKKMMEETSLQVVLKSHESVLFEHVHSLHGRNPTKDEAGNDLETERKIIGTLWRKKSSEGDKNVVKLNEKTKNGNEK